MPEMHTMFSRRSPSSGRKLCTAARIAESPHPGHQRTSWSEEYSLRLLLASANGTSDRPLRLWSGTLMLDHIPECVGELFGLERQAAYPREGARVDQEPRADDHRELAEVHLGHDDSGVTANDLAGVGGQRVE